MSIINDALKKAEQFRKWEKPDTAQKPDSSYGFGTAVLEEPLPRIQSAQPNASTAVQTLLSTASRPIHFKQPIVPKGPPPSHSFLFVSLMGLSILIVAALFVLLYNFSISGRTAQAILQPAQIVPQEASRVVPEPQSVANTPQSITPALPSITEENQGSAKSAPARERRVPKSPKSLYQLTGIYGIGGKERYAFINGKIVEAGGIINDAEVVSIDETSVTLRRGRHVFVLTMP